ncbi:hypothetical protein SBRY_110116 [Actinacidiphila bryophytorum]|uniref:Uncharacterized protein n=1 Tax=Actinacidiphila bryophytorum TaxID=1436133 RepID=A0A9W4E7Z2_9ACTN|nr:hypothetical protein SBRY_110116 [Actinacidiphila bryophytorum]
MLVTTNGSLFQHTNSDDPSAHGNLKDTDAQRRLLDGARGLIPGTCRGRIPCWSRRWPPAGVRRLHRRRFPLLAGGSHNEWWCMGG